MACPDCERHKLEENVDGLYEDVDELQRVKRNQGIALAVIICAGFILLSRLNAYGILTWSQLAKAPVGD